MQLKMLEQNEIWKDIPEYEGKYQISSLGRVKSLGWINIRSRGRLSKKEDKILKTHITHMGYERLELNKNNKGKKFVVHRLVALAFISNPEMKTEVNHIDGNKLNNTLENLEWNTSKENINHAIKTKLNCPVSGQNHCCAKLTNSQVKEIREKFKSGLFTNQTKVAKMYDVSRSAIWQIVNNRAWRNI